MQAKRALPKVNKILAQRLMSGETADGKKKKTKKTKKPKLPEAGAADGQVTISACVVVVCACVRMHASERATH
jgi:hypothetical protein